MEAATLHLPARLRRVAHVAQRQLGEETLVLDLRRARIYGFNPTAGRVLEWLRSGPATDEVTAWASAAGDRDGELAGFLATLLEHGLVEVEESAPGASAPARPEAPAPWSSPRLLWQEEVARVTHQTSPPQALTNPQCQP